MATSGAMADFGRLSNGKKVALFVGIAVVFGFIYYKFAYKSLAADVKKAEAAYKQATTKNKELEDAIPKFQELRKKKGQLDEDFISMQKALPTDAEIPAFFETIERKLTDAGISDMKFTKKPEQPFDQFVKVPFEVELTGTFMQIKRFFASLVDKKATGGREKERERIVSIESLSLTQPTIRDRQLVLTAKFRAVTFRQQSAAPAAPTAPGQPPADSPAPAAATGAGPGGGTSTPPPLPSADTPAGAKANIDDSTQKVEQRREEKTKDPGTGSARLQGGI